jgi:serine/threonine protein kinase
LLGEDEDDDNELVGTEEYISPEALENIASSEVTFATDLWSLGVIIWQIFSKDNTTPFAAESQSLTF